MRAVGYLRYSTDHQTENSLEYQLQGISEFCKSRNIGLIGSYSDAGDTGTNTDRKNYLAMIEAATRKAFDCIVFYDLTRGSRDVVDWFSFRKSMRMLGIEVLSVKDDLGDILDPNKFLNELITIGIGQHHVLTSRDKSIAGSKQKSLQGLFMGGIAPLGYDIMDRQYSINPREAEAIRTIYSMYLAGKRYTDISAAVSFCKTRKGNAIGNNAIIDILKNEIYMGNYTYYKHNYSVMRKFVGKKLCPDVVRLEGAVPAIIDKETWKKTREKMGDHSMKAKNRSKRDYLLTGSITCGKCGAKYIGRTTRNTKGVETVYYVCQNKYKKLCDAPNIKADEFETFVLNAIKEYVATFDFDRISQKLTLQVNSTSDDLTIETKELDKLEKKIKTALSLFLENPDFTEVKEELNRMRLRKSELEDILRVKSFSSKNITVPEMKKILRTKVKDFTTVDHSIIETYIQDIFADNGSVSVSVGVVFESGSGGQIRTNDRSGMNRVL